jgi:hypothetical protein
MRTTVSWRDTVSALKEPARSGSEDGGSRLLQNIGNILSDYASHPRTQQFSYHYYFSLCYDLFAKILTFCCINVILFAYLFCGLWYGIKIIKYLYFFNDCTWIKGFILVEFMGLLMLFVCTGSKCTLDSCMINSSEFMTSYQAMQPMQFYYSDPYFCYLH